MDPSTVCLDGNWYCDDHGKEYEISRRVVEQCSYPGCDNEGLVRQNATGAFFCPTHCWTAERGPLDNEHGLNHPEATPAPKTAIVYVAPAKKALDNVLTRWQAIADFQDYIAEGLQVVMESNARYDSNNIPPTAAQYQKTLQGALKLIEVYQMQMAGYEQKKWDLGRVVDTCKPTRAALDKIKADKEHEAAKRKIEHERKEKSEEKSDGTR